MWLEGFVERASVAGSQDQDTLVVFGLQRKVVDSRRECWGSED